MMSHLLKTSVTRLDEFSPFGRFYVFGNFFLVDGFASNEKCQKLDF